MEDELFMTDFAKHKKQYYQEKLRWSKAMSKRDGGLWWDVES